MSQKLIIGTAIGALTAILVTFGTRLDNFFLTDILDSYEFRSYDSRVRHSVQDVPESSLDSIVIVDIDQTSIQDLGNFRNWPQAYHGKLIDVLDSGVVKSILFDIIFDPENTKAYDFIDSLVGVVSASGTGDTALTDYLKSHHPEKFVQSTELSQSVIHALVLGPADSLNFLYSMDSEPAGFNASKFGLDIPPEQANRLPSAERFDNTFVELLSAAAAVGTVNFPQDSDGLIRRAPTAIQFKGSGAVYPSLTMAAAMKELDVAEDGLAYDFDAMLLRLTNRQGQLMREIPIDDKGRMFIHYYGYHKTFYYLPYSYCMDPDMLQPEYWQDRFAIVGSSLPGLMDLTNTPVQESFAGVEIHANVLNSILRNEFLKPASLNQNHLAILLLSIVVALLSITLRRLVFTVPAVLLMFFAWMFFGYQQYESAWIMWEGVRPALAMSLSFLGVFVYDFLVVEKDKRFLKETFGTYISPELIEEMNAKRQLPELGGVEGYHSAFFSDIQNFSTFSEILSASDLIELLNQYLTSLTNILLENKGTLDKYIGDAIVAFFGSPAPLENHEYLLCKTALDMQQALAELRQKWTDEGERWPVEVHQMQTRIGLNSGPMVTGNVGSATRMNYTMMGDTVNLAARLESSAKQYGVYILVGENTYQKVRDEFEWRFIDLVRVKGKRKPVKVYELLSYMGKLDKNLIQMRADYEQGLVMYQQQKWAEAIVNFEKSARHEKDFPGRPTNPSRVYLHRSKAMLENPPGDHWDGVWTMTTK